MKHTKILFLVFSLIAATGMAANPGDVVITEIMYNAASSEATTETQFIELANRTSSPISLLNWTIDDEDADGPNTLPDVSIPGHGMAVIVGGAASTFTTAWAASIDPSVVIISLADLGQVMVNFSNSPSATSEIIQLADETATVIDEVNYDDAAPWPVDNNASSIYLNISEAQLLASGDTDNDDGANWALSANGVDGAIDSTAFGYWTAVDTGSPGNFFGSGSVPVELMSFSVE